MVNLKYALALLMALNIFLLTISVINFMDLQRLLRFTNDLTSFSSEGQDLEYALAMLKGSQGQEFCAIVDAAYQKKILKNNELMEKMLGYERASMFTEFQALKKQFLIANVQLWQISQMEKEYCPAGHTDVLYIYSSDPGCLECIAQGRILDAVRGRCPSARTFVMDIKEDLSSLEIVKKKYNVTSAPSLVIGGKTYPGVLKEGEIANLLGCS
jgi:hypothetical protein